MVVPILAHRAPKLETGRETRPLQFGAVQSAKLKFAPQYRSRGPMAVKTAAQGITNCPRALPAKLKFEHLLKFLKISAPQTGSYVGNVL